MAGMLFANPGPNFRGHYSLFQFTNADGADWNTACGQAAIATVLANYGRIPKTVQGLRTIEKDYPADVVSGALGTSCSRVLRALDGYNLGHRYAAGLEGLKEALGRKRAVIALIQNTGGLGGIGDGAHWFVVFGCDDQGVHVTNYAPTLLPWSRFDEMWSAPVPAVVGLCARAIAC